MRIHPVIPLIVAVLLAGMAGHAFLPVRIETPRAGAAPTPSTGPLVEPAAARGPAVAATNGKDAVMVPVAGVIGLAGLVLPGDRVDVFVTQRRVGLNAPSSAAMTDRVLHNVRVLAIAAEDESEPREVTLELTPKEREMIALASRLGRLSLMLRSAGGSVATIAPAEAVSAEVTATPGKGSVTTDPLQPQNAVLR